MLNSKRVGARIAVTAALAAAALAGAGFAVANAGAKSPASAHQPAAASAPATNPAAAAVPVQQAAAPAGQESAATPSLRTVDWKNATLKLPRLQPGKICAGGTVKFRNGVATTKTGSYRILGKGAQAAYGNLLGDRRDEAVLPVDCSPPNSEYSRHLVGVTGKPGALQVLGDAISAEDWNVWINSARITGGAVKVTVSERFTDRPRTQIRDFAWTGTYFQQVSGPVKFPPPVVDGANYDWSTATLALPFKAATTTVQPNDRSCPRGIVKFTHVSDGVGAVQAGGCEYWVRRVGTTDLDGNGTLDSLVKISALKLGTSDLTTGAEWYFAYTFRNGKPALISFVTAAGLDNRDDNAQPDVTTTSVRTSIREVRVTQVFRTPGKPNQTLNRTFRWSGGTRFAVNVAAPNPRADLAP